VIKIRTLLIGHAVPFAGHARMLYPNGTIILHDDRLAYEMRDIIIQEAFVVTSPAHPLERRDRYFHYA
jgi:hypothetical protein